MARGTYFMILVATLIIATEPVRSQSSDAAPLVQKHSELKKCQSFLESFASAIDAPLRGLPKFIDAVENQVPICNRLCEGKVVPAYRLSGAATCTDLIIYVLTSTCYGYLPDDEHRGAAFRMLESTVTLLKTHELSEPEKHSFRTMVGDTLRTWEGEEFPEGNTKFKALRDAWTSAGTLKQKTYLRSTPLTCENQKAAYDACNVVQPSNAKACLAK
jgi:hypothetical protein